MKPHRILPALSAVLLCSALFASAVLPLFDASGSRAESVNPTLVEERVRVDTIPEKDAQPGLDDTLHRVTKLAQVQTNPSDAQLVAAAPGVKAAGGMVQAVATVADGMSEQVADAVNSLGGSVEASYGDLLQVRLPPTAVERLTRVPGVLYLNTPLAPVPLAVTTEGISGMGLEPWHDAGFRGGGAKLAIVDIGFDGYWNVLGSEIPANAVLRSFRADGDITGGGDAHGTAAAEIAHDIAPEATLYLVNFGTAVEMGNAVDWLISQKVNVISSSVGWPGTAYGDGQGMVNSIVQKADTAGILWVQAAGNFGLTHWTGMFNDPDGNGFANISGNDEGNTISLRRTRANEERVFRVEIFLTWDGWNDLTQDYDLFLFRGDSVVAQSTAFQNGSFPPVEHIVYTTASPGDYWIAVQRFRATRRLKLDVTVTVDYGMEYVVPAESLVVPADSPFALTVGAVEPGTLSVRAYSSQGPTKDGRIKPDLVAGDQVSTATYGTRGFTGTSAAAPHVAGAAALLKGARFSAPPAELRRQLVQRAIGPGMGSANTQIGAGYVNLGQLLGAVFLPFVPKAAGLGF